MKSQSHSSRIQPPQWQNQTIPSSFTSGKDRQTPPDTFGSCFWPTQEAPAPKAALGILWMHGWGASPFLWCSQQMALAGAEQTRWWIFHTERFLLDGFKGLVERWIWWFLPVVCPGRTHWVFGTQGCFVTRVLSGSAGRMAPIEIIIHCSTLTQKCSSISSIGVFFQTQPVGLTLHRHVGLQWEQTQLPELQLIRRCFHWVREEL